VTLVAGAKLGRYEIRSKLGAGGMGEVYEGRDMQLGRDVAVKVLPTTVSSDPDRLRRFEQEACAASALNTQTYSSFTTSALTMGPLTLYQNFWREKHCASESLERRWASVERSITHYKLRTD
jgi:serine/threonine protein kinase